MAPEALVRVDENDNRNETTGQETRLDDNGTEYNIKEQEACAPASGRPIGSLPESDNRVQAV